jgi:hypothetical protein
MALFLTLLDRFKNHIFYERERMKKLALFSKIVIYLTYAERELPAVVLQKSAHAGNFFPQKLTTIFVTNNKNMKIKK